jgi:hypothetical protein
LRKQSFLVSELAMQQQLGLPSCQRIQQAVGQSQSKTSACHHDKLAKRKPRPKEELGSKGADDQMADYPIGPTLRFSKIERDHPTRECFENSMKFQSSGKVNPVEIKEDYSTTTAGVIYVPSAELDAKMG